MANKLNTDLDVSTQKINLSKRVSIGAVWISIAGICARGLNLISAIILARILEPEDFGLMAIAMAIIVFSQGTTQTGFESALIQNQENSEDFLNTAWTFELTKYLVLFSIIFLTAPLVANIFNEPRAVNILRVLSISLVFQGIRNIGVVYFRKKLDFSKQFVLEIVPLVVNTFIVIPLAFILRNVWALVLANIATTITTCAMSYFMHPYRPRLEIKIEKIVMLFNFGKWIFGTSILVMIREQGVSMFIGKFLGVPILGFYNRAQAFSIMIFQQISEIVWKVGYPAYALIQFEPDRLKKAYLNTLQLLTFILIPMAGGFFVLSRDFVYLLLTDKWLPIVPLLQIFCLQAILNSINTPSGIVFQAAGRPSINTKISMFGTTILFIIIYPLTAKWGSTGSATALLFSSLIPSPIVWYMALKTIRCSFYEFIKPILISLLNTGIMVSLILTIKEYHGVQIGVIDFVALVFVGAITYSLMTLIFDKYAKYGGYRLIIERIAVLR